MNKFIRSTFVILFFLATTQGNPTSFGSSKLQFGFYITSQCKATMKFITTQLYPTYQELGEHFSVEFVPWGKTKRLDNGTLDCQFGPTDCAANRLQLCALSKLGTDQPKMMEYINCEMSTLSSVSQNYTCVSQVGLSASAVQDCVDSAEGDALEIEAEGKTSKIVVVYLPTVVRNGNYSPFVQMGKKDFKKYVCKFLKNENLPACN